MKLSLAIQTPEVEPVVPVALISGSFEEKLSKAATWGADGVELMTIKPRALDWEQIASCLAQNRLQVAAVASGAMLFATGITLLHRDSEVMAMARSRLYDLIEFASALGSPVVTIGSFRGRLASVPGDGKLILHQILQEAAERAEQLGVRLAIEAINRFETDFIHNARQGLSFIQEVNRPALGLLLDTFHMNIEESSWSLPFQIAMQAGKLFHVHFGDNNRLPPGKGMINFAAIVEILRSLDYQGYLSAELLAIPDPDSAARQTLETMHSILQA